MVSSTLNPQAITGNNAATPSSFGDFMTGGRASSSSGVMNAANKIVGFNRPNVAPASSNLNNVVSNISTNVLNSVSGSVSNLGSSLQNQFNQALQRFTQDYQKRIKGFDDNRPGNVLTKFLDLYKNAIGFINFFADRRNIRTIESSLKSLRKIFQESFEVAAVIRQTIVKIVKQLSNLPTASPSSGGLDLNIAVPGGKLKQAGGPAVRNVGRGRGGAMLAGAGLLAVGGAGMAISGGMNKAKEYQESMLAQGVKPGEETQNIPESIVESFSAIVDRFTSAVNSLIGGAKKSSGSGSGGGGGGGPSSPPPGPSSYSPGTIPENVKADTEFTSGVTDLAKKYNIPEDYLYAVMGFETGGTYSPSKRNEKSGATGLIQFTPRTAKGLGTTTEELSTMSRAEQLKYVDKYLSNKKVEGATLEDLYMSVLFPAAVGAPNDYVLFGKGALPGYTGDAYTRNIGLDLDGDGSITKAEAANKVKKYLPKIEGSPTASSSVTAAPAQTQAAQARAQTISQPAQKQKPLQTVSLPPTVIDAGGGQSQAGGGAAAQPIPASSSGSYEVPMLPTTNPDNFLTMYSRIVYNIVDG